MDGERGARCRRFAFGDMKVPASERDPNIHEAGTAGWAESKDELDLKDQSGAGAADREKLQSWRAEKEGPGEEAQSAKREVRSAKCR